MRRVLAIAVIFLAVPALAQIRGIPPSVTSIGPLGMHGHGFGHFGGGFGHFGHGFGKFGHFGHGFGRRHFGNGVFFNGSFGSFHDPSFRVFIGSRSRRLHRRGFFGGGFGQPFVPLVVGGGGYPIVVQAEPQYVSDDEDSEYTVRRRRADSVSREELREMIAEELADYRAENRSRDRSRDAEEQPAPRPQPKGRPQPSPQAAPEPPREGPPTVLVFRDGRRVEVTNYAIVGPTIYQFTPERKKMLLADLDVDATMKLNEDRGVQFHLPTARKPARRR